MYFQKAIKEWGILGINYVDRRIGESIDFVDHSLDFEIQHIQRRVCFASIFGQLIADENAMFNIVPPEYERTKSKSRAHRPPVITLKVKVLAHQFENKTRASGAGSYVQQPQLQPIKLNRRIMRMVPQLVGSLEVYRSRA